MREPLSWVKWKLRSAVESVKKQTRSNFIPSENSTPPKFIRMLEQLEICTGSVAGKKILEIGCDKEGKFLANVTAKRKLTEAVGINIALEHDVIGDSFSLLKADARELPFEDAHFDLITSMSAFEHIHDFARALNEMHRVLRPGGYLFAEFAPIWSSVWGHHLWLYHGKDVRDWHNTPLPPYAHLLMTEAELRRWVEDVYEDSSLTNKIVNFVYRSEDQNRLFFSDYEDIVGRSPFKTLFMVGFGDLPPPANYAVEGFQEVLVKLGKEFPDKSGFGYHGITMLLQKNQEADAGTVT